MECNLFNIKILQILLLSKYMQFVDFKTPPKQKFIVSSSSQLALHPAFVPLASGVYFSKHKGNFMNILNFS